MVKDGVLNGRKILKQTYIYCLCYWNYLGFNRNYDLFYKLVLLALVVYRLFLYNFIILKKGEQAL